MNRLLGTAVMIAGLSIPAMAQDTGMSGSRTGSASGTTDMTPMTRTTATELESDRDFDLGWLGLLGLAGLAGIRRRSHVHHTGPVGTDTHTHDHNRMDRM